MPRLTERVPNRKALAVWFHAAGYRWELRPGDHGQLLSLRNVHHSKELGQVVQGTSVYWRWWLRAPSSWSDLLIMSRQHPRLKATGYDNSGDARRAAERALWRIREWGGEARELAR